MPREQSVKESSFPFYAWECVTLHLKHRDVDLVIRNEKQMNLLLKFLVHSLDTIDGRRGSAAPLRAVLISKSLKDRTNAPSPERLAERIDH
jgi:hypothetical protein